MRKVSFTFTPCSTFCCKPIAHQKTVQLIFIISSTSETGTNIEFAWKTLYIGNNTFSLQWVFNENNTPLDWLEFSCLPIQIGAVYIWTYCYNIIRVYGSKSTGSFGSFRTSSTLSISFSGKSRERLSGSFTEAFLSKDSGISEDPEAPPELLSTLSMDKMKVRISLKNFGEDVFYMLS